MVITISPQSVQDSLPWSSEILIPLRIRNIFKVRVNIFKQRKEPYQRAVFCMVLIKELQRMLDGEVPHHRISVLHLGLKRLHGLCQRSIKESRRYHQVDLFLAFPSPV